MALSGSSGPEGSQGSPWGLSLLFVVGSCPFSARCHTGLIAMGMHVDFVLLMGGVNSASLGCCHRGPLGTLYLYNYEMSPVFLAHSSGPLWRLLALYHWSCG